MPLDQYPQKGRATAGVVTTELVEQERILLAMLINDEDQLLTTWSGSNGQKGEQVTALKGSELKAFSRASRGVPLVDGRISGIIKL